MHEPVVDRGRVREREMPEVEVRDPDRQRDERVDDDAPPSTGGEDFSFLVEKRPGAYIFIGNGDSSELHTDTYDFNDAVIPVGASYWVRLAERALPIR